MAITTVNPATGETIRTFEALSAQQIEEKLECAARAFRVNRGRSFSERATRMNRAADLLDSRAPELGKLMTTEMGKPIKAAVAEAQKCALACRYYAAHAEAFLT